LAVEIGHADRVARCLLQKVVHLILYWDAWSVPPLLLPIRHAHVPSFGQRFRNLTLDETDSTSVSVQVQHQAFDCLLHRCLSSIASSLLMVPFDDGLADIFPWNHLFWHRAFNAF